MDEALGFAVGARRIGPGAKMPEPEGLAHDPKPARDIAAAVVTHDPANGHGAGGNPRHTAVEKGRAGVAPLVGQDLDIGAPAVVIDSDMHILPADTRKTMPARSQLLLTLAHSSTWCRSSPFRN